MYNPVASSSEHGGVEVSSNQIEEQLEPDSWRTVAAKYIPDELLNPANTELRLLFVSKSVRLFGFGFLAVMLVTFLATLNFTATQIGLLFSMTLIGDAAISLFITSNADRVGRRKMLLIGAVLSLTTSAIFCAVKSYWLLMLAATLGVISPAGNEVGPFMAIELSAIAQLTSEESRTSLMAWYNLVSSFSSAIGALFCGLLLSFLTNSSGDAHRPYQIVMSFYVLLQAAKLACFYSLGPSIEVPDVTKATAKESPVTLFLGLHKSKQIVLQLCCLFMLDSFAGSFVLQSVISHWFYVKFDTSAHIIGLIVFVCNIIAGISALLAARIASMIGLIMTMVVTHLPSNVLLMLVPLMPTETSAIVLLCFRYSISQMDVPTRNAYVQGVVASDERSAANGLTNVCRSVGASLGPACAGLMFERFGGSSGGPFIVAGMLKIIYDLLLLHNMQGIKPTSEMAKTASVTADEEEDQEGLPKSGKVDDEDQDDTVEL